MELRGRRVLITGASRGIGESLAYAFAGAGARVALVARSRDSPESVAAELGGTVHPADLSDPTHVASLIQGVEDDGGPIDVLVNHAGIESTAGFTGWFGLALNTGRARVLVPGVELDVTVEDVGVGPSGLREDVDDAYRAKYGGGSTGNMVGDEAAATTLRLLSE